jgi:SAM-dependent methyltransferase
MTRASTSLPLYMPRNVAPSTYAERTFDSPYWLIRYAHLRRYAAVVSLIVEANPATILDYGAGDGSMIISLLNHPKCSASLKVIAFEPWDTTPSNILKRVAASGHDGRVDAVLALDAIPDQACEVLTCGGVLEHLTLSERFKFYEFARRALRPGGRVLIDVPIELGPSVLIKTFGRRVLKRDPPEYTLRETLAAVAGLTVFDPERFDPDSTVDFFVTHKGFDYRLLKKELAGQGFLVEGQTNSPIRWLPALLANQEVIISASLCPTTGEGTDLTPPDGTTC